LNVLSKILAIRKIGNRALHSISHPSSPSLPPPKEYTFYKSLQQTVLSRSFVSTAVHSAEARRLLLYLATSEAPDEIFFPTLLHLPPHAAHASRATCNGTLHFSHWIRPGGSWHPEYLTPLHLPLLLEKMRSSSSSSSGLPAFWARKFDVNKGSSALMGTLDYHRECRHVFEYEEGDMDWAPAIVFAREMEGKIGVREGWEEEGGGGGGGGGGGVCVSGGEIGRAGGDGGGYVGAFGQGTEESGC